MGGEGMPVGAVRWPWRYLCVIMLLHIQQVASLKCYLGGKKLYSVGCAPGVNWCYRGTFFKRGGNNIEARCATAADVRAVEAHFPKTKNNHTYVDPAAQKCARTHHSSDMIVDE